MNRLFKSNFRLIVRRHYRLSLCCGLVLVILVGLGSCKFKKGEGEDGDSTSDAAVLAPPESVQLKTPALSPSFSSTPTFTVQGVEAGDTVRLFSAEDCNVESLLGSGVVGAGQNKLDITISTLPAIGNYPIYAQRTSVQGKVSACSAQLSSYDLFACPDESYVPVEGNATLGVDAFCVFKTEAKKGEGNIPNSAYEGLPWASIRAGDAKAACQRIVVEHGSCDLISNPEWMAIARDIEATAANWSGEVVGSGRINQGHVDYNPDSPLSISDPTNEWDQIEVEPLPWKYKRTHVLSDGGVLWDLGGNLLEWVDWETGGDTFSLGPTTCENTAKSPLSYSCADLHPNDYLPLNPAGLSEEEYKSSNTGIGKIVGGTGGAALRSGCHGTWNADETGIFRLSVDRRITDFAPYYTFRCVCRP